MSAGAAVRPQVGPEVPVTATNFLVRQANNSPLLAVDPTDSRFVALANRIDQPDFSCALELSGNGGQSWVSARPVPKLPTGAEKCYGPDVAFDRSGTLYYSFVGLQGLGNRPMGVFLTSSSDRGRHWKRPRRILGPLRFQMRMAIDQRSGRMHLVWLESRAEPTLGGFAPVANPIMAAYSDDKGRRFSQPVQVSDPARSRVLAPALALGPRGEVYVAYWDLRDDVRDYQGLEGPTWDRPWSLVVAASTDRGRRFSSSQVVNDQVVPPQRVLLAFTMPPPSIVAGPSGRVYAAWHDARNGDWDAFVAASSDRGRTWGPPVRINDDPIRNGRHQYLPRLSVAPDGRLDAVFYDRRNAPDNVGNDVYYTASEDGGATFSPNVRVTTFNFDPRVGARYANPSDPALFDFGGRIALVSQRQRALAAWTDTRNTAELGRPSQDIYAAQIRLDRSAARPAGAAPAGTR